MTQTDLASQINFSHHYLLYTSLSVGLSFQLSTIIWSFPLTMAVRK